VAKIIVLERAAAEDVAVGFREFFRIGLPVTIATLSLGAVWLWVTSQLTSASAMCRFHEQGAFDNLSWGQSCLIITPP
jgi:hypothetical protein